MQPHQRHLGGETVVFGIPGADVVDRGLCAAFGYRPPTEPAKRPHKLRGFDDALEGAIHRSVGYDAIVLGALFRVDLEIDYDLLRGIFEAGLRFDGHVIEAVALHNVHQAINAALYFVRRKLSAQFQFRCDRQLSLVRRFGHAIYPDVSYEISRFGQEFQHHAIRP